MAEPTTDGNVASRLRVIATLAPGGIAIAEPDGPPQSGGQRSYALTTFGNLDARTEEIARGLIEWGVRPGMRLAMLVPFGASFIEMVFALLKAGAVLVLIDPGIGRKHLIRCLSDSEPEGFVGIPKAQAIRTLLKAKFPEAKWNVTLGRRWFWGGRTLDQILAAGQKSTVELPNRQLSDDAAIIFTTGSTGPPKGVLYTHGTFQAQIDRIRDRYEINRGSVDLACFPLFGLFDAVMGVTTVIPDMDPSRPADVNPRRLIEAAGQWNCDQAFGSPALWNTVIQWSESNQVQRPLPTLRRVLSAGAPFPADNLEKLQRLVDPEAEISTPYGATEALPIASIESREVITETGRAAAKGRGTCVGTRFDDVQWKVIEINDGPLPEMGSVHEVPIGKIGELMVAGPMVTERYVVRADQNELHKVRDGDRVWHRMGDVGYLDDQDRFWFCGRKAHRITMGDRTLFTVPCEAVINTHDAVFRSALVPRGERPHQKPVIVVELNPEYRPKTETERQQLIKELRDLAARNPMTRRINEFIFRDRPLPVDIRHNSKIFREQLAAELTG